MKRWISGVVILMMCVLLLSSSESLAAETKTEKDLQQALIKSKALINTISTKIQAGYWANDEINSLKALATDIKGFAVSLADKFRTREEDLKSRGAKAQERHQVMEEGVRMSLEEYLGIIEGLPEGPAHGSDIERLKSLLDKISPKKKGQIFGSLPYRNLNYPAQKPSQSATIVPAYKGGNKTANSEDTASTKEASITEEIASLAESLNWNPVSIYEYVKNNIETEWYWGCMKGAGETLTQKSGNDCDQAALLTALLRASGFPTRYVRGTIRFYPDMEKAKNLVGIDDASNLAEFFQKAGIPYIPVISGGKISNFEIEHIWVESMIPYDNYRGAIIDEEGKTWLGLDTSLKVKGYAYNSATDVFQQSTLYSRLSTAWDDYLGELRTETPVEYVEAMLISAGYGLSELERTQTLNLDVMNILPAAMQFQQTKITNEYTEIPDELMQKVRFSATDKNGNELFTITFDTLELSNRQITISCEPETVEDQETVDSYGGLDNTPAYLVRLRPILKVNGEMAADGNDGLPMGEEYSFSVDIISPNSTETAVNTLITGNVVSLGVVSQKSSGRLSVGEDDDAEKIQHKEAINYIDRWNDAEDELASLFHLVLVRPVPTVVAVGGMIDVTYLLDVPHGFEWKGEYVDASFRAVSVHPSAASGSGNRSPSSEDRKKTFMQLSALEGSVLEHRIFEDDIEVPSVSTANLLQYAHSTAAVVVFIDKSNLSSVIPTLDLSENATDEITNAVNQNYTVQIPKGEVIYNDWTGWGYLEEEPDTGESGYMLSGMIAGGMTAVSPDNWLDQDLRDRLARPYRSIDVISITSPVTGSITYDSAIVVTGVVANNNIQVNVNRVEAVVEGTEFSAVIELSHGKNKITASATTSLGSTVGDTVYVTQKTPVALIITFPFEGAELSSSLIFVEGFVSDPGATVNVNGINARVSSDGKFTAEGIALSEGLNQITVQASNQDGATDSQSITVNYKPSQSDPVLLTITSPNEGEVLTSPSVIVEGTVTTSASEVWVKVNGRVAEVYGGRFSANGIALADGDNRIVVDALDSNGSAARVEVSVSAATSNPHITLNANITSGLPPLQTYFTLSSELPNIIVNYQIDFEGDGVVDFITGTFEDVSFTYATEGIYHPTVTVTDEEGNIYSAAVAITVLNKAQIDALLKEKWEGMKAALKQKDTETALGYFVERSKERYRSIFEALKDQLPTILDTFVEFNITDVYENIAECEIVANENGVLYSYPGLLIQDGNGIWKFKDF